MGLVNCKGCRNKEKENCDLTMQVLDCDFFEPVKKGTKKFIDGGGLGAKEEQRQDKKDSRP